MSHPDLLVRISRHKHVSLRYTDIHGEEQDMLNLPQDLSELFQHECDHLDGLLALYVA